MENTKNLESWAELIQTERYQMLKEETIAHRQINQVFANEIQFLNKSLLEKDNYIRELEKKSIERDLMLNDVINELGSLSRSVQVAVCDHYTSKLIGVILVGNGSTSFRGPLSKRKVRYARD